ncbi:hypothetical protein C7M84_009849 [Penaeus vannamei]|uniref:Uncharacterized protein n=2 Tax=Penaeus vannamei TaxID=6689 RepID=A0A3R7PN43_PENVA|nr:hypothetical protein C7M84_009849 [Penaeus vannamei]
MNLHEITPETPDRPAAPWSYVYTDKAAICVIDSDALKPPSVSNMKVSVLISLALTLALASAAPAPAPVGMMDPASNPFIPSFVKNFIPSASEIAALAALHTTPAPPPLPTAAKPAAPAVPAAAATVAAIIPVAPVVGV